MDERCGVGASVEGGAVVDQADRADPGGDEQAHARPGRRWWRARSSVAASTADGVVELRPAARRRPRRAWRPATAAPERSPAATAARPAARARESTAAAAALVRRQAHVAAREGQPVGLADGGAARPSRPAATGRAPCAARRPAAGSPSGRSRPGTGPAMANSLATTVATPSKWPGARGALPGSLTPRTDTVVDGGVGPRRVHLGHGRDEDDVGARLGAHAPGRARGCAGSARCPRGRRTAAG